MSMRVLAAAVLSAILMFLWGFVFWGPVLNATVKLMAPLPADAEMDVLAPMRSSKMADGMYVYPGPCTGRLQSDLDAWEAKIKEGPVFHLAYHSQGVSPMDPTMFAKGLAHNFVTALLVAALVALAAPALPTFGSRAGFVLLVSLVAALWTNVGNVIWWFHTPQYAAGQIAYTLGAGLAMALVIAAIVRPAQPAAAR